MNKEQKQNEVERLKEKFTKAQLAILTDYKGLKVSEFNELRRKLTAKQSEIQVVKNRLAKIALKGSNIEGLSSHFVGTTAVTTTSVDPTGPAKILVEFAKGHKAIKFKAATMDGKSINQADIESLAELPSYEELVAKLLGSMMAPARNLVSVLAQIPRQVVNVLAAVRDQKEKTGEGGK